MSEPQSFDVTQVIDESRISGAQWTVLGISLLTALFDGYDTQGIAYVAPVMAHDLGFPPADLGPIFSAGLLGLTLGAIFFGMLADKLGRKQMIIWPMVIFGVFSLATPLGHTVQSLVILRILAGFGLGGTRFTLEPQLHGITVKHLFTDGRAYPTAMLWIAFVMNLFILVYMIFWMPTLLREAGQPLNVAITVTIMYGIGGIVGGLVTGFIADRIGSLPKVLAVAYVGATIFIIVGAFSVHETAILYPAMFLTGFSINGGQPCLNTIAATFYPTAIRATGIGWALAVGRIGAVIAPLIGGFLVAAHFAVPTVILANVIPAIIAAAAIVLFHRRHAAQQR